ncbi:MAG: flagellar basal body rod protein FlgB, partial [Acetobacteraceae bacterium]
MDLTNIGLFSLAAQRMKWLDQRQTVLAQNVANSDTPGYTPSDLPPFAATLADAAGTLRRSSPRQLPGAVPDLLSGRARPEARAPDGNAVSLDTQLKDIADTATDQDLVATIYSKYLAMFQLALGDGTG